MTGERVEEEVEQSQGVDGETTPGDDAVSPEPDAQGADPLAVLKAIDRALEALPRLAPFALLAGWLTVSTYARALGVQPGDLGIGITEVLVLAVINLGVGLVLSVGIWKLQSGGRRAQAMGCAMVAVGGALLFSSVSLVGCVLGLLIGGASWIVTAVTQRIAKAKAEGQTEPSGQPMSVKDLLRGLGGLALVPAMLVVLQVWAAHASGSELRRKGTADLPLALTVVLPADHGVLGPESDCLVRVAPRVYIDAGVVSVLAEVPARFAVGC